MGGDTRFEVRPARADEIEQLGALGAYVYAGAYGDGTDNVVTRSNRAEWTLCAFVAGRMAASYATIPFTARADGRAIALGGVTAVGTLPEYRRQGMLRAITLRAFAQMREHGQGVAALWASQAAIYQRYGYALGSLQTTYRIDGVDIGFADGDEGSARVERVGVEQGFDVVKRVYVDFVAERTLYLHRAQVIWRSNALSGNDATGPAHVAIAYRAGAPTGYLVYHVREGRTGHRTRGQELTIKDLAWLDADAYRSLWSWIKRHDLVGRVVWARAPADDPAAEIFVEPRLLHAEIRDGVWVRIVDAAAALSQRGYRVDDALVVEIEQDDLAPWNAGRFLLETSDGAARFSPTRRSADVRLNVKALASLFTGMRSARELANWGLLDGDDRAIERATRLFATRHAPHCPDNF